MPKPIKEVTAVLPDFYIAFVLQDAKRGPTEEEVDQIRLQTVSFWSKQLQEEFFPFIRLELNVAKTKFGKRDGDDDEVPGLEGECNMYMELTGQAIFNGKFKGLPSGDDVYREMLTGDSMNYLVDFVRGIRTGNIFGTALEVTARRVKPLSGGGGTVICPTFLVAFGLDQDDPEAKIPDGVLPEKLMEEWKKRTHKAMKANLRREWPDTFESFELETTLAEKGNGKPDSRFDVYTENEASAKFSANAPSPEDVFRVLMKSASTDSTVYLLDLHDMDGTPFSCVTTVTIQLVGMELPEAEELPPMDKQEEEKEQEQGEGEGEGEDGEEEVDDYVTMDLPIFLALVLNVEPPAETPSNEELLEFKDLMLRFFYTTVKKEYPQIKKMDLQEKETKFDAGQPEARYNMCVKYDARFQFHKDDEIPEKEAIQKMIMEVNLSSMLAHIKNLEPLCFKHTTEVTMREKGKDKPDAPFEPDATFEAAVDPPPLLEAPPPIVVEKEEEVPPPRALKEPMSTSTRSVPPPEKKQTPEKPKSRKEKPADPPKKLEKVEPVPPKKPAVVEKPKAVPPKTEKPKEEKLDRSVVRSEPKPKQEKFDRSVRSEAKPAAPKKNGETKKSQPPAPPAAESPAPPKKNGETKNKSSQPPPEVIEPAPETPKSKKPSKSKPDSNKPPKELEPPMSPPAQPKNNVRSSDIHCAIRLDRYSGPPSAEQMKAFLKNACEYFKKELVNRFPRFVNLDLSFAETAHGEADTKAKTGKDFVAGMNFFAVFILSASFRDTDSPTSPVTKLVESSGKHLAAHGLPTPYELTRAILQNCDVIQFLLQAVRIIPDSDFKSASSCLIQQRVDD